MALSLAIANAASRFRSLVASQTLLLFLFQFSGFSEFSDIYAQKKGSVYNILWAVVFGFATLNILSLAAKRLEPARRGLSFGELLAVLVVVLSVFLLGWEMLTLFHIFPIKLKR